jgi:hypothetical protein
MKMDEKPVTVRLSGSKLSLAFEPKMAEEGLAENMCRSSLSVRREICSSFMRIKKQYCPRL